MDKKNTKEKMSLFARVGFAIRPNCLKNIALKFLIYQLQTVHEPKGICLQF